MVTFIFVFNYKERQNVISVSLASKNAMKVTSFIKLLMFNLHV